MIISAIRFAVWISGRIVSLQPDAEYGYSKTAFKQKPVAEPDIRNAFNDILKIQTFEKSCTLHNHSFVIFRSLFSASCAMTPSLSMV